MSQVIQIADSLHLLMLQIIFASMRQTLCVHMQQVHSMVQRLAQFTDVRTALVVGGLSQQIQASTLRSQPEIVVATPVSVLHF